jgi:hypothetical protein
MDHNQKHHRHLPWGNRGADASASGRRLMHFEITNVPGRPVKYYTNKIGLTVYDAVEAAVKKSDIKRQPGDEIRIFIDDKSSGKLTTQEAKEMKVVNGMVILLIGPVKA